MDFTKFTPERRIGRTDQGNHACAPNASRESPSGRSTRTRSSGPGRKSASARRTARSTPCPSLAIEDGAIVEMDGVASEDFDLVEIFIARHAIDLAVAERAMGTPSLDIARMIVDINVPRAAVLEIVGGCTPAKLVDIVNQMNVLEMMMGLAKMRARRTPANQAHVTNRKEHPALLAADAAEAALRGFAEIETTVAVARYAPVQRARDPGRLADRRAAACSRSARSRRRPTCAWASRA